MFKVALAVLMLAMPSIDDIANNDAPIADMACPACEQPLSAMCLYDMVESDFTLNQILDLRNLQAATEADIVLDDTLITDYDED